MSLPHFKAASFWSRFSCQSMELHVWQWPDLKNRRVGSSSGCVEKRYGLNTFVVEPTKSSILRPKGIVVIVPDIFGWTLPETRLVAVEMAKKGPFIVLLPDVMDGYIVPASLVSSFRTMRSPGFLALFKKLYHAVRILYWVVPFHRRNSDQAVQDRLVHFLDGVHGEQPNMPLGIAGYGWGSKFGAQLIVNIAPSTQNREPEDGTEAASGRGWQGHMISCVFAACHSSMTWTTDVAAVQVPLSIAATTHIGSQRSDERMGHMKFVLAENTRRAANEGSKTKHAVLQYEEESLACTEVELYEKQGRRVRRATMQATRWFARWLDLARSSLELE